MIKHLQSVLDQETPWTSRLSLVDLMNETPTIQPQRLAEAKQHWLNCCKPLGSFGALEDLISHLYALSDEPVLQLTRSALAIFCADNGIVSSGVTQTSQAVTRTVAENLVKGITAASILARQTHTEILPIDVGICGELPIAGVVQAKVCPNGTANFLAEPALSETDVLHAMGIGATVARWAKSAGYQLMLGGEMGIGNTTTSAAVLSCLLNEDPAAVTGRGAGLSSDGLQHKIQVIRQGLVERRPDPADPIHVLSQVGGLDLAALSGFYLGCARYRLPVLLDGMIALTAALVATRLNPLASPYLIASHTPKEPGGALALKQLALQGILQLSLANGEGVGALFALPVLQMGVAVFNEIATFDQGGVPAYRPLK